MIVINISKNRSHYFCESLISQCQYAYLFELFLILCAFFFVRNKSGDRRARSLSEKRAGFCTGSFTAEASGLRTIVVVVIFLIQREFFFHRLKHSNLLRDFWLLTFCFHCFSRFLSFLFSVVLPHPYLPH